MCIRDSIIVHTIGIGDPAATGEDRVDFGVLQGIARATGGQFFKAEDLASLQAVYATLDRITPQEVKTLRHQPKRDYFWLPLGLALCLLAAWHGVAALLARRNRVAGPHGKRAREEGQAWTST